MAYRFCSKCGWGYSPEEWKESRHCSNCGASLGAWSGSGEQPWRERRPEPLPTPVYDPPRIDYYATLGKFAREHPWCFSAGAVGTGVGAIMVAPQVLVFGQAAMAIGVVLICAGMVASIYADRDDGSELVCAGWLVFLAGLAIALLASLLAIAGIVAVAGGSGVALKAGAEEALRWRIRKQMQEKSFTELLALSRQMDA